VSHCDIQFATTQSPLPTAEQINQWINATLTKKNRQGELSIRIVDEAEMTDLNTRYRHKPKPTNVLSFPCPLPFDLADDFLGDIVICAPVIAKEAIEQQKPLLAHWAHMVIHGLLHLLGHDHVAEDEALLMEGLEIEILQSLGYNNPYRVNS
jgi:probable rRNA maturation factor